jgi:hypothetical protein
VRATLSKQFPLTRLTGIVGARPGEKYYQRVVDGREQHFTSFPFLLKLLIVSDWLHASSII